MTQEEILQIVKEKPGIKQYELLGLTGLSKHVVSKQVTALRKWKLIRREKLQNKKSFTYKLYLAEQEPLGGGLGQ